MINNLDKIYIRATGNDGKWGSYSIKELYDMGRPVEVYRWFMNRMFAWDEGSEISLEQLDMMVNALKICGHNVVELKDEK